ncbi:MAG: ubiquitin-like small modifier protein 1 [Anaerolineales bacterium]|nr:ubiquitin-like small modifier protein 1 [Anaerolineales bacterium]
MTAVKVPTPLRPYTEGQKELEVEANTVGEALENLADTYPGLKKHLFDDEGNLRSYVNVFVNEDDVRGLEGEDTPIGPDDQVTIVPSIAGGARRTMR